MAAQPGAPGEPGATLCDEKGVPLPKVKPDKKKDPAGEKRKSKERKRASKEAKRKSEEKSSKSESPPSGKKKRKKRSSRVKEVPDVPSDSDSDDNDASAKTGIIVPVPVAPMSASQKAAYDQQFHKQAAYEACKLPTIEISILEQLKVSPKLAWPKLLAKFQIAKTDPRLFATALLKSLPPGFFNTAEMSSLAQLGNTVQAFTVLKDKVFARYVSFTDAKVIRDQLNNIQFCTISGPPGYFSEIRQCIEVSASVSGSDIVPLTILQKAVAEIPADIAELVLMRVPLTARETAFQAYTFSDLSWLDNLQSEIQIIYDRMVQAGKVLTARSVPTLNALGGVIGNIHANQVELSKQFQSDFKALVDSKSPAFAAMMNQNGYSRGAHKKKEWKDGKRKPSADVKKLKKEKFSGDTAELIAHLETVYEAADWAERCKLVQSGKAINVEGNPYDKLFVKDKAKKQNGTNKWVCMKCGTFGHTASRCMDLKTATNWKQTAGK